MLKPVNDARLAKTIERLRQRLAASDESGDLARLLEQMVAEVVFFEALDKYVNVVTQDGEALIRVSLKELVPQLDGRQVWQIHRGTIVNAGCVASAARDEAGKVSLPLRTRPEKLRVSPLYAHLFRQM